MHMAEQGLVTAEAASPYIDDPEKRALLRRGKPKASPLQVAVAGSV